MFPSMLEFFLYSLVLSLNIDPWIFLAHFRFSVYISLVKNKQTNNNKTNIEQQRTTRNSNNQLTFAEFQILTLLHLVWKKLQKS